MSAKAEIGWRRTDDDGVEYQVYARHVGNEWRFFERQKRYDVWQPVSKPSLSDWLELLDAVERRIQRRLLPPQEAVRVRQRIRSLFPEADTGA